MTNMNQHELINKNLDIQITFDAASQEHPHPPHLTALPNPPCCRILFYL